MQTNMKARARRLPAPPIADRGPQRVAPTAKDTLLSRIRARRKTIEAREGLLPETYPMIRADRDSR